MTKEQKRKNFERIVSKRVVKITKDLDALLNLTNSSFYDYEDKQIDAVLLIIETKFRIVKKCLKKHDRRVNIL